ncbi:DUF1801 domain-containing protein [Actinoplanes sp. KI2]|uniref:DUF1801 domain-containing protein n=1 Tax=Actinoplanes sp. KI2 TaxID=2983315 RepID=UPI0021D5F845|nr:DUF1801 domain-containing protein [Actinoplanes sp. KI2]MCU7731161.1 DUF1801 domain-containing protein [Actinoplanes sp. KI2]
MNDEVKRLLATRDQHIAELTEQLCELILQLYPEATVTVDGGDIGFGAGTGYRGLVFVVSPHSRHVTLGLAHGAELPDPAGLLDGSGRVHRHVKLRSANDLQRTELHELMAAALRRRP